MPGDLTGALGDSAWARKNILIAVAANARVPPTATAAPTAAATAVVGLTA